MKITFVSQEYVVQGCEYATFVRNDGMIQVKIE
jgi:hypothetical protein